LCLEMMLVLLLWELASVTTLAKVGVLVK